MVRASLIVTETFVPEPERGEDMSHADIGWKDILDRETNKLIGPDLRVWLRNSEGPALSEQSE